MGTLGTTIIPASPRPFSGNVDMRRVVVEPVEATDGYPTTLTALTVEEPDGMQHLLSPLLLSPTACRLLAGALEAAADAQEHREQRRRDMR